jgi:UDP-3-O-[3-hydroxymyristoyl] N-acetylglucosamine deacetylase
MTKLSPPPAPLQAAAACPNALAAGTLLGSLEGPGLLSGKHFRVNLLAPHPGQGLRFELPRQRVIPASLQAVVHAQRGVTLGHSSGATLSIVEHCLGAAALAGVEHLTLQVEALEALETERYELPLLDGSGLPWFERFESLPLALRSGLQRPWQSLPNAVQLPSFAFSGSPTRKKAFQSKVKLYALPNTQAEPGLKLSYGLDYPHPLTQNQFAVWDSRKDDPKTLAAAGTFGLTKDLPLLQAQGMALGVSVENTLGLNEDGSTTRPLRSEQEPLLHKMLDLLGDCQLAGINLCRLNAHVVALHAGHEAHLVFAQQLAQALRPAQLKALSLV